MQNYYQKMNPYYWAVLIFLAVLVGGAIYAATTWNVERRGDEFDHKDTQTSQLPDQSKASGLQMQSSSGLNNAVSSDSLQAPTASNSALNSQNSASTTNNGVDYNYPSDPNLCRGVHMGQDTMCLAP